MLKAIDKSTGKAVKCGDVVTDFRGVLWTFDCATRANEQGRDGKVYVKRDGEGREFYARVVGLEVQP